jgi:hypothetical protein
MLLSAYRELKQDQADSVELAAHLEECAACRAFLAQSSFIGKQLQVLPIIEPHPEAYNHLMQALAREHTYFMQHSASSVASTPDFLKPYLKEQGASTEETNTLVAFSSAETGPLPIIRPRHSRRLFSLNQYAVIGLAAAFLLVIMTSGLISLLVLANQGTKPIATNSTSGSSLVTPPDVSMATYTTSTSYTQVISAIGNRRYIYYTGYNPNTHSWMLEQLDTTTKESIDLLPNASSSALVLFGSSQHWLVWLQLNAPKTIVPKHMHTVETQERTWQLEALPLDVLQQAPIISSAPITLLSGTFNEDNVPIWVHTPIQGIWFGDNNLLVAMIDQAGTSHLLSFQLPVTSSSKVVSTEIATAYSNHILTSPTANSDGTDIFWSEEWQTADGNLHSNIWMQQTLKVPAASQIQGKPRTVTLRSLFRSDEMSFQPQVVNNTLFFLSTNPNDSNNTGSATGTGTNTPAVTATVAAKSTPTARTNQTSTSSTTSIIPRQDASIYTAQIDTSVQGTLLMLPLNGSTFTPTALNSTGLASALQAGAGFLLWQGEKGYKMYDVQASQFVNVGQTTGNAVFLAVNRNTTVWITSTNTNPNSNSSSTADTVSFSVFNWPTNAQAAS